jgi:hypothetical protein
MLPEPCQSGTGEVAELAEGGGLLNRYTAQKPYRGFESLPLLCARLSWRQL